MEEELRRKKCGNMKPKMSERSTKYCPILYITLKLRKCRWTFTLVGPQLTSDIYPHDKSKAIDERLASILLINDYSKMTT